MLEFVVLLVIGGNTQVSAAQCHTSEDESHLHLRVGPTRDLDDHVEVGTFAFVRRLQGNIVERRDEAIGATCESRELLNSAVYIFTNIQYQD